MATARPSESRLRLGSSSLAGAAQNAAAVCLRQSKEVHTMHRATATLARAAARAPSARASVPVRNFSAPAPKKLNRSLRLFERKCLGSIADPVFASCRDYAFCTPYKISYLLHVLSTVANRV